MADSGLLRHIMDFRAIDDHAHPLGLGIEEQGDPAQPIQPYDYPLPVRMRQDNPEYFDAWKALWGYEHRDFELGHLQDLLEKKNTIRAAQGEAYNSWVLDQSNIDAMVNISIDAHPTLPAGRFPWCAHVDWLLWPIVTNPIAHPMINLHHGALQRKLGDLGLDRLPKTLDDFLDGLLRPAMKAAKDRGAVGFKFNVPYYRDLSFAIQDHAEAAPLYAGGIERGSLTIAEHRVVQDKIFLELALEAGRLGLPIQIHTGFGVGRFFNLPGSNPALMVPLLRAAKGTRFLLLHGGWPYVQETAALLSFDNVWTDFSCGTLFHYPHKLAEQIRTALEWFPEKLMFGTDAYSDRFYGMMSGGVKPNALSSWEEKAWLMNRTGREALAIALGGMMDSGAIDAKGADRLSAMVMRETVRGFHHLPQ